MWWNVVKIQQGQVGPFATDVQAVVGEDKVQLKSVIWRWNEYPLRCEQVSEKRKGRWLSRPL